MARCSAGAAHREKQQLVCHELCTLMALIWEANVLQCHKTGSQVPTRNSAVFYQFSAINITYISFEYSVKISWPNKLI